MWSCLLLVGLVGASDALVAGVSEPIPDCDGRDCPTFTLLNRNEEYEERLYGELTWLATRFVSDASPNSGVFWDDRVPARQRIFAYFKGENIDNEVINASRPMLTRVCNTSFEDPPCNGEHTLSMFLPDRGTPYPAPTNPAVRFFTSPGGINFARPFRGAWANRIKDHRENLRKLWQALKEAGESWFENYSYFATYHPDETNGYEEAWLPKKP